MSVAPCARKRNRCSLGHRGHARDAGRPWSLPTGDLQQALSRNARNNDLVFIAMHQNALLRRIAGLLGETSRQAAR